MKSLWKWGLFPASGITKLWVNRAQWTGSWNRDTSKKYKRLLHLNLSRNLSNYPVHIFNSLSNLSRFRWQWTNNNHYLHRLRCHLSYLFTQVSIWLQGQYIRGCQGLRVTSLNIRVGISLQLRALIAIDAWKGLARRSIHTQTILHIRDIPGSMPTTTQQSAR